MMSRKLVITITIDDQETIDDYADHLDEIPHDLYETPRYLLERAAVTAEIVEEGEKT